MPLGNAALLLLLLLLLLLSCSADGSNSSKLSTKYRLMKHLMSAYPEDGTETVPSSNLVVNVELNILSIFGLSSTEVMEMNGWAQILWKDPRLQWNSDKWPGVDSVHLPASKVWVPDIGITNAKQLENKDFSAKEKLRVEVLTAGEVVYYSYFLSETPCPLNTARFPFDVQECSVIIGTTFSRSTDFVINVSSVDTRTSRIARDSISQWILLTSKTASRSFNRDPGSGNARLSFQEVNVSIILQRKPMYHVVLIIVPYCLLAVVGSIMFVIREPDQRFSISLTILLAMSVYVMIVAQDAPKSMDEFSIMDTFLLTQMGLVTLLTFVIVILPTLCRKAKIMAAVNEEGGLNLPTRRARYKILGRRIPPWNRKCDCVSLAVYLVASFLNGFVCLGVMRWTVRSVVDS